MPCLSFTATLPFVITQIDVAGNAGICGPVPASLRRLMHIRPSGAGLGAECAWQSAVDALLRFKDGISSDPRSVLASWQPSAPPCGVAAWQGIACSVTGDVVGLNLTRAGLVGTLPDSLAGLDALREAHLAGNAFAGSLPPDWSASSHLEVGRTTHDIAFA